MIEASTPPRARVLTAQSPSRATLLTGRRTVVGLPFHIWSHGIDAEGPSADVRRMYAGGEEAARLLATYRVDFVLLGPQERAASWARTSPISRGSRRWGRRRGPASIESPAEASAPDQAVEG